MGQDTEMYGKTIHIRFKDKRTRFCGLLFLMDTCYSNQIKSDQIYC